MTRPAMLDWRLLPEGVQVYADWQGANQGWIQMSCKCPECGHRWQGVAAVGSLGIECPECGHCEVDYEWQEVEA